MRLAHISERGLKELSNQGLFGDDQISSLRLYEKCEPSRILVSRDVVLDEELMLQSKVETEIVAIQPETT